MVAMDMAHSLLPSDSSLYPLLLRAPNYSSFKTFKFGAYCSSGRSIQVYAAKTKRKPRPSFSEQIRDKWSVRVPSTREKFPWEEQKQQQLQEQDEEEEIEASGAFFSEAEIDASPSVSDDSVSFTLPNRLITAPWIHGSTPQRTHFYSHHKNGENVNGIFYHLEETAVYAVVDKAKSLETEANYNKICKEGDDVLHVDDTESFEEEANYNDKCKEETVILGAVSVELPRDKLSRDDNSSSIELPWERKREVESLDGDWRRKRSNTDLAERILPEHELKRLRNVALRMFERIKVGAAGITQDLVDAVHAKWRLDEVVKLKFEGPLSCNMKRTHEILETRTGGLVIWRSGSSVVLYRGMAYKFQCVQSYSKQNESEKDILSHSEEVTSNAACSVGVKDFTGTRESVMPDYAKYLKHLSQDELMDFSELDQLLDELGPRFKDWCGREPLPVDADLLPAVDPEYKPPFRLLPYGVRHYLTNKEMTVFRRLARTVPPHFALGRNRELQGLAKAIVKLWKRSAIAKIAIKRGVQNTRNERMAEELKILTGGILLSRNKEYIVFYRGNDFLPPAIMETLKERRKLTYLKQDEEEQARQMNLPFIESNAKNTEGMVAGTLAETRAATSHWMNYLGGEGVEEMLRDASLARLTSLVKHLQNKLALAKMKTQKADKALAKVKHFAISLEAESGGVLVSVDRTTKGYAIIIYRGKNYLRPHVMRPANLLTKRQALARSIELQRREALKHHISDLQERIQLMKLELEEMESGKKIDVEKTLSSMSDTKVSESDVEEPNAHNQANQAKEKGKRSVLLKSPKSLMLKRQELPISVDGSQLETKTNLKTKWKCLTRTKQSSVRIEEIPANSNATPVPRAEDNISLPDKRNKSEETNQSNAKKLRVDNSNDELVEVASHK
ncbi:hypothetical protein GH714_001294 [Hevea brasiliensis]|uniref:CRM domain-containing protein n=1 Tax=Hevea brasiliensis TaxID=3981 RepID=A0A6A6LRM3_HEVBR|nr:hypothetical protein GH714_001294 [Hevea brasiliensis]